MTHDLHTLARHRAATMAKFVHLDGMQHSKDREECEAWRQAKHDYAAAEREYQKATAKMTTKQIEAIEQSLKVVP